MRQFEAWLRQAKSDLIAAELLHKEARTNRDLVCQALAKYQQVVEKSVKAIASSVQVIGFEITITPSHLPNNEISALLKVKAPGDKLPVSMLRLLEKRREEIYRLCQLAPRYPKEGEKFKRNTEYPFEKEDEWTAPAIEFDLKQLDKASQLANALNQEAVNFASLLKRAGA